MIVKAKPKSTTVGTGGGECRPSRRALLTRMFDEGAGKEAMEGLGARGLRIRMALYPAVHHLQLRLRQAEGQIILTLYLAVPKVAFPVLGVAVHAEGAHQPPPPS